MRTDSLDAHREVGGARRAVVGVLNTAVAFGAIAPQIASAFDYAPAAPRTAIEWSSDVWVESE